MFQVFTYIGPEQDFILYLQKLIKYKYPQNPMSTKPQYGSPASHWLILVTWEAW